MTPECGLFRNRGCSGTPPLTYLENGPHTAVHSGVGNLSGDLGPQSSSPNGKFFFSYSGEDGWGVADV